MFFSGMQVVLASLVLIPSFGSFPVSSSFFSGRPEKNPPIPYHGGGGNFFVRSSEKKYIFFWLASLLCYLSYYTILCSWRSHTVLLRAVLQYYYVCIKMNSWKSLGRKGKGIIIIIIFTILPWCTVQYIHEVAIACLKCTTLLPYGTLTPRRKAPKMLLFC